MVSGQLKLDDFGQVFRFLKYILWTSYFFFPNSIYVYIVGNLFTYQCLRRDINQKSKNFRLTFIGHLAKSPAGSWKEKSNIISVFKNSESIRKIDMSNTV